VLRITSVKSGTQWAIGLNGCQYGKEKHFWRWSHFESVCVKCLVKVYPFGTQKEMHRLQGEVYGNCSLDSGLVGEVVAHMDKAVVMWEKDLITPLRYIIGMADEPSSAAGTSLINHMDFAVREYIDNNNFTSRVRAVREYEKKYEDIREFKRRHIVDKFLESRNTLEEAEEEWEDPSYMDDDFMREFAKVLGLQNLY
jgi:hypothetical protein